jgi:hypothetical protein
VRFREPAVARRREERLTEIPAALTGQYAALAKSLESCEVAAAALAKAEVMCAADLTPAVLAPGVVQFMENARDPEGMLRKLQAAESSLAARRAALEAGFRILESPARLLTQPCLVR